MKPGFVDWKSKWIEAPPMWRRRYRSTMTATPTRGITIIGGSGTRTVEQIHDHTLFWSEGPSLPYDLEDSSAVAIGESIYLFGGWMYVGATDNVLYLGEGGIRWMKIGKMQYARHWFSAVRYDNDIWMIGGELSGTSEIFHAETNSTEIVEIDNFKPPKGHTAVILPRHD